MSDKPISYMPTDGLSYDPEEPRYWDAAALDAEIRRIIDDGYQRARDILGGNEVLLKLLAERLLENEYIEGDDFREFIANHS